MKRRILSVLLCLSMAVGMLVGCGSEEEAVKVTKKLEEQYVARIEAYQGYLDEIGDKYSEYWIGATVTLDSEGLPLMWVSLGESDAWSDIITTQLVSYEDKQATVLAEKGEAIVPHRGKLIMAQGYNNDAIYLYDEEEMSFVSVTDKLEYSSDDYDTIYSEKELDEKVEDLTQMLECTSFYDTIRMAMNDETHQLVYLGKREPDFYYQVLGNLHVLLPVMNTKISDATDYYAIGLALRKEYAENKDVLNYFKQLEDAELDEDVKNELLSDEEVTSYIYDNIIKEIPSINTYILPDGTVCTHKESLDYANKIDIFTSDGNWEVSGFGEAGEYFDELNVERILRELQKKPIYSQEELYTYIVSVAYNCEVIEADLDDCILKNASDWYIDEIIEDYIDGGNFNETFFTDELINNHDSLLETEPYKIIRDQGVDSSSFEDNVITLTCYNEKEYQFQVEFNETGDKISKIEYIDPYANLPEWKKVYLNQLDMSQVWYSSLVDLNGDGIPEIVACADEDGQYMSWRIYYIDKTNAIQQIDITYSSFNYSSEKIYSSGGHTGECWDIVYAYNPSTGVYDLVFDGVWYDNFDGDGNYIPVYQISGADVSEEEYNQKLNDITADITNSYSGDENFSQDTDVTDLIMEYDSIKSISDMESFDDEANIPYTETTYNTYEYCIYQFEQKDGILTVAADDGAAVADGFGLQDSFSFSYPIAEDCTWESGHWDDGFVPYEQIDMETVVQGINEWRNDYELFPDELESPAEICFDIVNDKIVRVYRIVP